MRFVGVFITNDNRIDKAYICPKCGAGFYKMSLLKWHLETHIEEIHYPFYKDYVNVKTEKCEVSSSEMNTDCNSNKYICTKCNETFEKENILLNHMRIHMSDHPYTGKGLSKEKASEYVCTVCERKFTYKSNLIVHLRVHARERPYKCGECGKTFSTSCNLSRHTLTHTGERNFKCTFCNKHYTNNSDILRHRSKSCCKKFITETTNLKSHVISHTKNDTNHLEDHIDATSEKEHSSFYLCGMSPHDICDESVKSDNLKHYSNKDNTGKSYQTESPRYKNLSQSTTNIHHTEDEATDLKKLTSKSIGNFLCNECGKSCPSNFILDVHMRTHTGEKPYPCHLCNKTFASKSNLTRHIITHSGEKPYQCDDCDKAYASKAQLEIHQSSHTGEKSYPCIHCDKTYSHYKQLNSHLKTSHLQDKLFQCDQCDLTFKLEKSLRRHKRVHTTEKLFQCDQCDKSFKWNHVLKTHMKVHNKLVPPTI